MAGSYLSLLQCGDHVQVSVCPTSKPSFRLPPTSSPMPKMMFCAGTGLAPFRGFLQHCAIQLKAGQKLSRALLFVGCRYSVLDRLYAAEMDEWTKEGAVDVWYAFSLEKEFSEGCAYVPERMSKDHTDIVEMWRDGARVYVCGSREFAQRVGQAGREIARRSRPERYDEKELEEWFVKTLSERAASDVFD